MKKIILALLIIATISMPSTKASEIDSFSARHLLSKDASPILNTFTNGLIDRAIKESNQTNDYCSQKYLYKKMKKYLSGNVFHGPVEKYINYNPDGDIPVIRRPKSQSIYRAVGFFEAPVLNLFKTSLGGIVLIRTNDENVVVGADKFGHFFTEGLVYYNKAFKKKKGIPYVLDWGIKTEKGKFGYITTGVFSHGDLVANYLGMTFWANLVKVQIGKGTPFIKCDNGKWKKNKNFDWREYIDSAWDEGINCSHYKRSIQEKVQAQIATLERTQNTLLACPIDSLKLLSLQQKYQKMAEKILYHQ